MLEKFKEQFKLLTGNSLFPWQERLYSQHLSKGCIPTACSLPTGLGKTNVIAVWLLALASGAKIPRRLVYVVNRRTVVDQTTDEVTKYKLTIETEPELADLKLHVGFLLRRTTQISFRKLS